MRIRTPDLSSERGIALVIALLAMVVIAGVVGATFFSGHLEQVSGRNAMYGAQAFEAGEAGLTDVMTNWSPSAYNSLTAGDSVVLATASVGAMVGYQAKVQRLNDNLFLVRSTGQRVDRGGNILASRTVATAARLMLPGINMQAALTVNGPLTLGGTAEVHGIDAVPSGWSGYCPPATDTVVGIRSSSGSVTINGSNCAGFNCVDGEPPFQGNDPDVDAAMFTDFNGITFSDLAAMADKIVSGTLTGIGPTLTGAVPPRCDRSFIRNWGEPWSATIYGDCFDYFPIVYAPGNLRLSGGRGQGILLVDGDLELSGGVEFFGPVIVLGGVSSTGTGGHVYGGLMAQQATLDPSTITGNSVAQYSSCTIRRALLGTATAKPLRSRAWVQLYSND